MKLERVQGGGRVGMDDGSIVCKHSTLDRHSKALNNADVWLSNLWSSEVSNAKIRRSTLKNSVVTGGEVTFASLYNVTMSGGVVLGSCVANSTILGGQIMGKDLYQSVIADDAVVEGDTILDGVSLSGRMRVNRGIWCRPPRYFDLQYDGIDVGVTEGQDGTALIGCREQKMTDWIKKKTLWVKAIGWPLEVGDLLEAEFQKWLDEPIPMT